MGDGIPVNSTTFADEETWLELIRTAGLTFSFMHAADDWLKLQTPNCAKGNDLLMKQMLKKSQMSSWTVLCWM